MLYGAEKDIQVTIDNCFWNVIWFNLKRVSLAQNEADKKILYDNFVEKMIKSNLMDSEFTVYTPNQK